ncbi:MAG: recombinase family protein [Candidatus Methanomethylophilaceae archaeon]
MNKVALYARVSTDDGGQDPETQLYRLRSIAEGRDLSVFREYIDRASGKNLRRPALQELLKDGRKGRFDAVMIVKIDRLSRNVLDALYVLDDLRSAGVGLIITEEGIDTTTPWGRAIFSIIATLADLERSNISERTMLGLNRARSEGKTGGRPRHQLSPYQLEKARSILREQPGISQVKLAEQFQGVSRNTLVKQLREAGIL